MVYLNPFLVLKDNLFEARFAGFILRCWFLAVLQKVLLFAKMTNRGRSRIAHESLQTS